MNGGEVRSNGEHREEEDPAVLAALAASREEEDPAVLAALEASRREVEEPRESRGPIMMFSTLGRQEEEEEELEGEVEEEEAEEQVQAAIEASKEEEEPAAPPPPKESRGPVMMFSTLGRSEAWEEEAADDPEEQEEPGEPGDLDPDDEEEPAVQDEGVEDTAKKEKLNPTLRRAYITKVKPEKRYCSSDEDSDGTWGGAKRKKKKGAQAKTKAAAPAAAKKAAPTASGPATVFQCPHCNLTFETIGQLNVHKHSVHGEARPSVLDLGEAVIASLQEKAGAPKEKILKELLSSYGSMVEDADRVGSLLGIALVEGIEFGRLRQGTSGKKNWNNYWLQENAKKRRGVQEAWARDPAAVGDLSTSGGALADNILENSGEFVAIKEKLDKHNIQITTAVKKPEPPKPKSKAKKSKFDDDDDIEIVSEKISQKTKLKIAQKKKVASTKPKAVIKVNSAQGKQMLKNIVKTGKVPASMAKTSTSKTSAPLQTSETSFGDEEDEDEHLTCPTCFSAFWYPSQTYGHMTSVHNIENPEKYMKERKKSRR